MTMTSHALSSTAHRATASASAPASARFYVFRAGAGAAEEANYPTLYDAIVEADPSPGAAILRSADATKPHRGEKVALGDRDPEVWYLTPEGDLEPRTAELVEAEVAIASRETC